MALAVNELETKAKEKAVKEEDETDKEDKISSNDKEKAKKKAEEKKKAEKLAEKKEKLKQEKLEKEKELKAAKKKEENKLKMTTYVVKRGDTIYTVSKKTGVKSDIILENNPKISKKSLKVGTKLNVPSKNGIYYVVKSGENLTWNTRKNMTERDTCKERQN